MRCGSQGDEWFLSGLYRVSVKLVRSFGEGSVWSLSQQLSLAVALCRIMGLARGWKKMYCALLPFSQHAGEPVTELQLLFIDEPFLTLTDKVWVSESRSETCATRARMHVDLVSLLCLHVFFTVLA